MTRLGRGSEEQRYPFSAIVGQDLMKRALLLNVIDPSLGGVLIKGERGTAKSTGVRALIDLLPTIEVVQDCPFQCDPRDHRNLCRECRAKADAGQGLEVRQRPIRLVNLPIGTTEDRLLGSIDIERALRTGKKDFEPGLLAEANRGILYVDEVNLLNDQIVDLFLDAAASGRNVVEREGISMEHQSRFILVGTMNPEEGDLRPQLLDRFGLSVTIRGIESVEQRVEIVKRRLAFEADPEGFRQRWASEDEELARRIVKAKKVLEGIAFSDRLMETASKIALAMGTDGHRADIAMMKAARANAALEGRDQAIEEDLHLAAKLALPHRLKRDPLKKADLDEEKLRQLISDQSASETGGSTWVPIHRNKKGDKPNPSTAKSPVSCVTHLCPTNRQVGATIPWNRLHPGTHPGRRFVLPNARKTGIVRGFRPPLPHESLDDLSFLGSLCAAAPRLGISISAGKHHGGPAFTLQELRVRKRSRKTGLSLVLIVDASASMRTNDTMSITKGVIEALLRDLYLKRDKLGIVTFRHTGAEILLPLTHNIRDAAESVAKLPVGGRTPLAAGLMLGTRMLIQEKRKNPETVPVMLVFSDGRPNVSCFGVDALQETYHFACEVRRAKIDALFIDTELDPMAMGCGYEIARHMNAIYLPLDRFYHV